MVHFQYPQEEGKKAPKFIMLENVDRLLKSPASQRGRDFAVMLASLDQLARRRVARYHAAEYGFPQRRRRTFILGYKKGTNLHKEIKSGDKSRWIHKDGTIAKAFPVEKEAVGLREFEIEGDLGRVTKNFLPTKPAISPFGNAGIMSGKKGRRRRKSCSEILREAGCPQGCRDS